MYFGLVLLVLAWAAISRRYVKPVSGPRSRLPAYVVPIAALGSSALVIAQLVSSYYISATSGTCLFRMPIPTVGDGEFGTNVFLQGAIPVAIGFAQAGLLLLLYRGLREASNRRWVFPVACSAAISTIAAALVPVMTSPDPYVYISYANLGFDSYAAGLRHVDVPHLPLSAWCMNKLVPSVYGPLFIVYAKLLVGWTSNGTLAVVLLRVANVAWFALLLAAMRAARAPGYLIALTALNPVFAIQYVSGAHNDVIALALIVAAYAAARRSAAAAFALVVAAGLFKLPLAAVGAVAFTPIAPAWKRVALAAAAGIAAATISFWWAGPLYLAGMQWTNAILTPTSDRLQLATAVLGFVALAAAVLWKRFERTAAFTIPTITLHYLPAWYVAWGLPYALAAGSGLAFYLIVLPVASIFADETVSRPAQIAAFAIVAFAIALSLIRDIDRDAPSRFAE